jgi:hypothetical protein
MHSGAGFFTESRIRSIASRGRIGRVITWQKKASSLSSKIMSLQTKRNNLMTELKTREVSATKSFNDYITWRIAERQFQKRLAQIGTITRNKQAVDGEVDAVETMMKQVRVSESRVRERFNAGNVYYETEMNKELKPVGSDDGYHVAVGEYFITLPEVQGIGTKAERLSAIQPIERVQPSGA